MDPQNELYPDLDECVLEDRTLPAAGPGLFASPFLQVNPSSNALVLPFTSQSGPGGGISPGPSWYNLVLGRSAAGAGVPGPSSGGVLSVFSAQIRSFGGGGGGGGGGGAANPRGPGFSGYSSAFSSGFSFALGAQNNYGMTATTLGSVPVHTFGGGGGPTEEAPPSTGDETDANADSSLSQSASGLPGLGFGGALQDPGASLRNSLLGKIPGMVPRAIAPGPADMGP